MFAHWTRRSIMAAGIGVAASACAKQEEAPAPAPMGPILGGVRRVSPGLDALIAPDAQVEELGTGYQWAEGPLWIASGSYLLFTDVPGNAMYKWTQAGGVEEFLRPSGFAGADASHLREGGANGLALEAVGTVLMADTGNRNISRLDLSTKQKAIVVERYQGKRFNSPNDVVAHSSGAIYFTDPPYGLAGMADSPLRETPFHGVYRLGTDGALALVDDTLAFPNGIAFSPDEATLYVACSDSEKPQIMAYTLGANGLPSSSRQFFDSKSMQAEDAPGNPDGLAIDAAGNLFATGPGGVMVISALGELLGVIDSGRQTANCKFGEDGHTLFITCHDKLARVRTLTRGAGFV
jgi:gluconolactonase